MTFFGWFRFLGLGVFWFLGLGTWVWGLLVDDYVPSVPCSTLDNILQLLSIEFLIYGTILLPFTISSSLPSFHTTFPRPFRITMDGYTGRCGDFHFFCQSIPLFPSRNIPQWTLQHTHTHTLAQADINFLNAINRDPSQSNSSLPIPHHYHHHHH